MLTILENESKSAKEDQALYIKRAMEDIILQSDRTFKATLITGARQTGKSTVLRALFPERRSITFDDTYLEEQAKRNPDMFLQLNPTPITMDEVQYVPELFRQIKMVCDATDERGLFTLSGSQPLLLMKNASESLSIGIIRIIVPCADPLYRDWLYP